MLGDFPGCSLLCHVHRDELQLDRLSCVSHRYHRGQRAGGHRRHGDGQPDSNSQEDGQQELPGEESRGYRDARMYCCYLQR